MLTVMATLHITYKVKAIKDINFVLKAETKETVNDW